MLCCEEAGDGAVVGMWDFAYHNACWIIPKIIGKYSVANVIEPSAQMGAQLINSIPSGRKSDILQKFQSGLEIDPVVEVGG